jgi:hypothetical protein
MQLKELPGTGEVKLLRDDPHCGAKTMLVRLPPGGRTSAGVTILIIYDPVET